MKNSILLSLFLVVIAFSCKEPAMQTALNGEGTITYKITYVANNPYKKIDILPHETNLFFKNTRASFITTIMGVIQVVNLLDNGKKEFTSLLLNSFGENYAFTDIKEDVIGQENNPVYKIETTDITKVIAGLKCKKAVVNDLTNKKKFTIYYYPKLKLYLGNSPYKDFNYLLMEYQDTKYGLLMQLQATKVDFNPIDTNMLSLHGEYNWVDKKTFINIIKNLTTPI